MNKFKGMIDKKIAIVIAVVLVLAGGAFVFSQKGGKVNLSDPKQRIFHGIMGITDEYIKTANDFVPQLGVEKLYKKYEKDMTYTMDMELNTDYFKIMGLDKAGITFITKSNLKEKKMQADLAIKAGNLAGADISIVGSGDEYYLNVPSVYSKAFKINGKTLGEDLNNSVFKEMSGEDAKEIEKLKDLQIDPYSVSYSKEEIVKEYLDFAKEEISAFEKNLLVEKVDTEAKILEKIKNLGSEKTEIEQFNLKVKSEYLKPLLLKSLEYSNYRQFKAVKSEYLQSEFAKSFEEAKKDIENQEFPEEIEMKVFMEKDKIVAFNFNPDKNHTATVYLLGSKNTTDKIIMNVLSEEEEFDSTIELKTSEDKNEFLVKVDNMFNLTMTYIPKDMSLSGNLIAQGKEYMTINGKYENVKEGVGYDFVIDKMILKDGEKSSVNLTGKLKFDTEKPDVQLPKDSVEILKVNKEEFEKIAKEVMTNIQTNYGPLMMLMGGQGF